MPRLLDLTNQRFGRWLAISYAGSKKGWFCHCDCGKNRFVASSSLRSGRSQSCGCLNLETVIKRNTTHGEAEKSPEWRTWAAMRARCKLIGGRNYKYYGAKNITVCKRWNNYANFLADMGRKPSPKHTINRLDNHRGYEPSNCHWATPSEQAKNRKLNPEIWKRNLRHQH